jgi:hypothetical protein
MTETITKVSINYLESEILHPLYHQYGGQTSSQPAHISLDVRTGDLIPEANYEIGNAVPFDVWHGVIQRYGINNELTYTEINELMEALAPFAQRVIDGAEVGYNRQANLTASFSDDAQDAIESIEDKCEDLETTSGGVWQAEHWFSEDSAAEIYGITAKTTESELKTIIKKAIADARDEQDITVDDIESWIENELAQIKEEQ